MAFQYGDSVMVEITIGGVTQKLGVSADDFQEQFLFERVVNFLFNCSIVVTDNMLRDQEWNKGLRLIQ